MDYYSEYKSRLRTAQEAVSIVKSGDWVDYTTSTSMPFLLDAALSERKDELFDVKENEQRTRRMLIYLYNDENHLKEYTTDDKAGNADAMKPTGKEYNIG